MSKKSFAWLMVVVFAASCLPDFEDDGSTEVETGKPCSTDANCDDKNPCTIDRCPTDTRVCVTTKQASGLAPDSAQTAADCKSIVCNMGTPSSQEDPADFINDNNSCTTDACTNGKPTNEIMMDGAACAMGTKSGECKAGTCQISCANNNDCDDANPCSDDLCNTSSSTCVYTKLDGVPTPGFTPVLGDCTLHVCEGGLDTVINDDTDLPDDANPCTTDTCTAGVPSNPNVAAATYCTPGQTNVCDGNGLCVECTDASHCVNIVETECEKRSCVNNKCVIAYQGTDTLASPVLQTPADCKKVVCNGNMGTTVVPDDADLPVDGKLCTKDVCTNGTPMNPPEAQNFGCGANQYCDGAGKCVGCTMASQCAGTDDFCKTRTCIGNVCGYSYTAAGTDMPNGQTAGDCKVIECDGNGNAITSVLTSDVPVDGNPCTSDSCSLIGAPSNPATPINSACNVNGNDACDGNGSCKKSLGKVCGAGGDCVSTFCVDGVCCNSTCTTDCQSCNIAGSIGTCTDVPQGQEDNNCKAPTQACNINHDCDLLVAQPCGQNSNCLSNYCIDGVCCNQACTAACKSCSIMGSIGTCSNLPAGSQDNAPANVCSGMNQCDASGNCRKVTGTACMTAAECISGFCVDGVCCGSACTADCKVCNVMAGTCTNIAMGMDDGGCSGAAVSCDGAGTCKTENGQLCPGGGAANCFSGICADGVCCNMTCTTQCQGCNVMGNVGTCTNLPLNTDDPTAGTPCSGNNTCNGAGACKLKNGQMCGTNTNCASGNCMSFTCQP